MSLPFISAPGPWYSAYGQKGWSCPNGIQVTFGYGYPPYHIFFTNSTITNTTTGPLSTMEVWGPSNEDPGMQNYSIDAIPVVAGNVYRFALQDAKSEWAYSGVVEVHQASDSSGTCTESEAWDLKSDHGFLAFIVISGLVLCVLFGILFRRKVRNLQHANFMKRTRRRELRAAVIEPEVDNQAAAAVNIEMGDIAPVTDEEVTVQSEEDYDGMAKIIPLGDEEADIGMDLAPSISSTLDNNNLDGVLPGYHV